MACRVGQLYRNKLSTCRQAYEASGPRTSDWSTIHFVAGLGQVIGQTTAAARAYSSRAIPRAPSRGIVGIHGITQGKQGEVLVTPLEPQPVSPNSLKRKKNR